MSARADVAAVVIGRNEGPRLEVCLASLRGEAARVVYIDSGSTDGSVAAAERAGARTLRLDAATPFTAARARNVGFAALTGDGAPRYVQFVDGDCRIAPGWIAAAAAFLDARPDVAVVCGRRREIDPGASVYNALIDQEWNTPVGETSACGGDSLMRTDALRAVGGFDGGLICGEEPELCRRLRAAGWRVWRLDAEMTAHDAAILRFSQWWRRAVRSGWAYAEGAARFGGDVDRYNRRQRRSLLLWGAAVPAAAATAAAAGLIGAGWPAWALTAAAAASFPAMGLRVARGRARRFGEPWGAALRYGVFTMLSKPAQALGWLRYVRSRRRSALVKIIEYKAS